MKRLIPLFLVLFLIACNNAKDETASVAGKWKTTSIMLKGKTLDASKIDSLVSEAVIEARNYNVNEGLSFTPEDSLAEVNEIMGIYDQLFGLTYEFSGDSTFMMTYVPEGANAAKVDSGIYHYKAATKELTISVKKDDVLDSKTVKTMLTDSTLVLIHPDSTTHAFYKVK